MRIRNYSIVLLIICLAILYLIFINQGQPGPAQAKGEKIATTSDSITYNDWQKDSCGCLRLRSGDLAEKMIEQYNLMRGSKKEFLRVFGKPNITYSSKDGDQLEYYMNSQCTRNTIELECEKSYFVAIFVNDTLIETSQKIE